MLRSALGPIAGLLCFTLHGCGDGAVGSVGDLAFERRSDSFLEDYLAARRGPAEDDGTPVSGSWFGVAFCPSGPFPVDLAVDGNEATASVLPALGDARKTTPFHLDHLERTGAVEVDPAARTLRLDARPEPGVEPRRARGLQVRLMLAPDGSDRALLLLSETSPGRPRTCEAGIAGRDHAGEDLRTVAARLATLRGDRRAVVRQDCPSAWAAWLREAVTAGPDALRSPAFERAFDAPFDAMSAEDLLFASAALTGSCIGDVPTQERIAATRAAAMLRDYRTYGQFFLDGYRDTVATAWGTWANARLDAGAVVSLPAATALRRAPLDFGLRDHVALAGFDERIAAVGEALDAEQQNETFVRRIESDRDDFRRLLAIALQAESRGDVDLGLVAAGLDYYLAEAAERHAAAVTDPEDAAWLAAWVVQQEAGNCPAADPHVCEKAADAIRDRLDDLAETFADAEAEAFDRLAEDAEGLAGLAALVTFEREFRWRYGVLAEHDVFADHADERAELRRHLQAELAETLGARLASARTGPAMQAIEAEHFLDDELDGLPELVAALAERLETTRPFSGLPAAAYLNAIYNRDFARLRALDREYLAGVTPLMHFVAQQASAFGPLVDAMTGRRPGASADELRRGLANLTAVHAVIGTWLVDYQDVYQDCLRRDAPTFTITRRTDIVTRDGFGNEIDRMEGWTTRDAYRVNPEFAGQFEALFDAATGTAQAQLFDLFLNDARISTLRRGVRRVMDDFACDADAVHQFERGMLAYDAEMRRRRGR